MTPPTVRSSLRHHFASRFKVLLLLSSLVIGLAPRLSAGVPSITSFTLGPNPGLTSATFVVTFSEPVTGVDLNDFAINATGTAAGVITGVTADATGAIQTIAFNYSGSSGSI